MTVNEIITQCVDMYDGISVDEVFRCLGYVIKDINGKFRGLYDTRLAIDGTTLYNNYSYAKTALTGTIQIAPNGVLPSTLTGTNTAFLTQLVAGDYIIVGSTIYVINTITNNTTGTITAAGVTVAAGTTAYKVNSLTDIVLSGREKTMLKVIVNGVIAKAIDSFDRCYEREIAYIRRGFSNILFNHIPDTVTIEIEGLFALEVPTDRDEELAIPYAWESLLSTGTLYYLAKKRREKDDTNIYASTYYQFLRDFSEAQGMSIPQNRSDWNYWTQSRNYVTIDE